MGGGGWEQRPLIWCEQRPLIWGGGGWLDQLRLKLTQSPTGVGVKVGTELGNKQ